MRKGDVACSRHPKGFHEEFRNSPHRRDFPPWGPGTEELRAGRSPCGVVWHFPARSSLLINAAHGKDPEMEMSGAWEPVAKGLIPSTVATLKEQHEDSLGRGAFHLVISMEKSAVRFKCYRQHAHIQKRHPPESHPLFAPSPSPKNVTTWRTFSFYDNEKVGKNCCRNHRMLLRVCGWVQRFISIENSTRRCRRIRELYICIYIYIYLFLSAPRPRNVCGYLNRFHTHTNVWEL